MLDQILTKISYGLRYRYGCWAAILVFPYFKLQCTRLLDWASEKLSHFWVRLFLDNLKIVAITDRTHAKSKLVWHSITKPTVLKSKSQEIFFHKFWFKKWV